MKRKLMMLMAFLFVCVVSFATQKSNINGTVTSNEDGQPLNGAFITVKGTDIKAITNADGEFVLPQLPVSAKSLVVVFIGMEPQEVEIKSNMHIILQSKANLAANKDSNSLDQEMAITDCKNIANLGK